MPSMEYFLIEGGKPLKGSVRIGGAKNASFKLMIAALLAKDTSRLLNFSHISDVETVAKIIEQLGGKVDRAGERALFIDPSNLKAPQVDKSHGAQGRFSTMFIPPLLHRFGKAEVPSPGGDKIGKRPLDRHFAGLEAMGAKVIQHSSYIEVLAPEGLHGADYTFAKNTHTGTETLIMAATLAKGTTFLRNAALEPEIDDLIEFLNRCGAKIKRLLNRVIKIEGVDQLHGAIHKLMPDRNEAVSYACAALATKGDIVIENARAQDMRAFLETIEEMGAGYEIGNYGIRFFYQQPFTAISITTQPEPGFVTDWQPMMATVLTQAKGESSIHETIMIDRFQYVTDLKKMGANLQTFQPQVNNPELLYNFNLEDDDQDNKHAVKILGPTKLKPGDFTTNDIRHGATLIIAALTAAGTSKIYGLEHIDRGYEKIAQRLTTMGAKITRKKG